MLLLLLQLLRMVAAVLAAVMTMVVACMTVLILLLPGVANAGTPRIMTCLRACFRTDPSSSRHGVNYVLVLLLLQVGLVCQRVPDKQ